MSESVEVRLARLEERQRASERALKLQAREYDRRLMVLNHAHEQAVEVQNTYVTSEKFEDFTERDASEKAAIAKALTLAEGSKNGVGQLAGWIAGGFGLLLTVVSLVLVVGDVLTP